jgi:hypothetical protein
VAGYREFQTGEVLTAANVNDFLMNQSVMVFADATARTSALSGVVAEGMLTYNKDTGALEVYDGTAFVPAGAEPNLVAVKSALFTGTQSASVTAGSNVAVTNLSITHTLADAANKLIISAYLGTTGTSKGQGNVGLAVADDGTLIGIADAGGSRTRVGAGGFVSPSGVNNIITMPSVTFVYSPGDAVEHTFTVRAINLDTATETVFINRTQGDDDNASRPRGTSGFVIQEVKV